MQDCIQNSKTVLLVRNCFKVVIKKAVRLLKNAAGLVA